MDIKNNLQFLPKSMVGSDIMQMRVTDTAHDRGIPEQEVPESTALNFSELFNRALMKVNDQQVDAERLTQKMITDPSSVEMHTVTIAAEKARMAITFTKTIADLAIKTYRDLINLR
ncbi:MAG: flagellar hook-basal body complex protein FliE [Spirochaetia bacterium]|nr:flagellar hook-basal body complex protein FliE [Spirochaetia bacterium]